MIINDRGELFVLELGLKGLNSDVYSYFEKRCRKKSTKLHKPIPKGSMGRRIELLHVLNTNEI